MLREFLKDHDVYSLLAPKSRRITYPTFADRAAWQKLGRQEQEEILKLGEWAVSHPYPNLTADQYMAFTRTGNRIIFQNPYYERRRMLHYAALALCLTGDTEKYLDTVINGLWLICEESSWCISAHNNMGMLFQHPAAMRPLPDVESPVIDLFAAQTAAGVAWVIYLVGEELDKVTPLLRRRAALEIEKRIFVPFMTRDDFWWMGLIHNRPLNNWTTWILSNVMDALVIMEQDDHRLANALTRGMWMLDGYINSMPADGGCEEGIHYWNVAGAAMEDCLDVLWQATEGKIDFYGEEKIARILAYPLHVHAAGTWYLNFADCDAQPLMSGERLYHAGKMTHNPALMALGAEVLQVQPTIVVLDTPQLGRMLSRLFHPVEMPENASSRINGHLENLQVYSWPRGDFYAAIKGGNNGEGHGHNDVGSVLLYADGLPQVVDMGNTVYSAKSFGPGRNELMHVRSGYHNVAMINGVEQGHTAENKANVLEANDDGARMELKDAYPDAAGLTGYERSLRMDDNEVTLQDHITLKAPGEVAWVFMTREKPVVDAGCINLGHCVLHCDKGLTATVEEIPITDERMARNFPGSLFRLILTSKGRQDYQETFVFKK